MVKEWGYGCILSQTGQRMIQAYLNDPYEYMSQEPCDYCPYQNTDKCDEDNCKCMTYGIQKEGKEND